MAKLTKQQVTSIYNSKLAKSMLADRYGVATSTIRKIQAGVWHKKITGGVDIVRAETNASHNNGRYTFKGLRPDHKYKEEKKKIKIDKFEDVDTENFITAAPLPELPKGERFRTVEIYKGFEICFLCSGQYTQSYFIGKDGERFSSLYLSSAKGCKNVIDTHSRHIAESQKPIYK